MVKVKTPGRDAYRHTPITKFFPRVSNLNKSNATEDSKSLPRKAESFDTSCTTPESSQDDLCLTPPPSCIQSKPSSDKAKEVQYHSITTSLGDSDDDKLQNIPDVIGDDEDDDLLSSADLELAFSEKLSSRLFERSESSQSDEPALRRSTRPRKQVSFQQMVPTAEAVPLRGEIPFVNNSTSTGTNSNIAGKKYQYSLSSLLREKKHRDKAGYDIRAMESALNGDSLCELDDPFDVYDRTEVSAAILNEDIKREHLQQIFKEDEDDDLDQQLEFFTDNNTDLLERPTIQVSEDPAFALIAESSYDDEKLKHILCQDWIPQQYELGMELPSDTISWLLELISYEKDTIIIEAASHTLKRLAEISGRYSINTAVEPTSVPFSLIYEILCKFGASSRMLGYQCTLEEQAKSSLPFESSSEFPHIYNLQVLLKTIVPLVENRFLKFSNYEEIRQAIYVVLRMSLDRRISLISSYIERIVDSFLNLFQEDDWGSQVKLICEDIVSTCGVTTKFNAVTIENLPISIRGRLLRRLLAFKSLFTLKQMISEKNIVEEIIQRLKYLHGKIVDMRAAFMDRTKAKDLIHRLYMRLYYVTSNRRGKTQASILEYSSKKIQKGTLDMFIDQKC
ncbi:4129_t:CDS:10 [Gigaspora margarita]|uniref:4129_t:CDS:1 n=1 Tax=Gigaspora margarita TaxID=4874 RepID=A0ABM8VZP0_GIGMA|nr:4129_t:CDS:10 [Gigaspora margarita]